ncbi:hypothetical protein GGH99_000266 [Coemansia sp. RSA 1285]|nr:hypothetical protein GGH99_000266 [Coemansia sp. RSA 1285]
MAEHKNVVVAVRCRPLNSRERKRNGSCLVTMQGRQTTIEAPMDIQQRSSSIHGEQQQQQSREWRRTYNFDYSYWSATDASDPCFASQETVFADIGRAVLDHALSGYHCCVFAYGQTGSGKSYTMMGGQGREAGLIPRICQALFAAIGGDPSASAGSSAGSASHAGPDGGGTAVDESFHVEVSYLEIYNERVRDLLNPQQEPSGSTGGGLRVREHPSLGPYVEDLTKAAVSTVGQVLAHMSQGNKARTVAATNMNEASSRSHAVFTIMLTRRSHSRALDVVSERVARISLVDLAGSERAAATMATGVRLKEGARINQSLAALGKVISALADQEDRAHRQPAAASNPNTTPPASAAAAATQPSAAGAFVPYRDSVLTWLLKDSLGGNSRTFMIATISPADYGETLSTLRYADRAKHIVNVATVNEDATAKLVRELKEEIAELHKRLALAGPNSAQGGDLEDQLAANEKLIAEMNQTWEQKLQRTQTLQLEREQALAALGIAVDTNSAGVGVGLHAPRDIPHLVNLSEDPLMSECLVYNIKPGRTLVGAAADADVDIRLGGSSVAAHHCWFDYDQTSGALAVHPIGAGLVLVNGQHIRQPTQLYSGFRIIIGSSSVFRLNHPLQARRDRARGIALPPLTESAPSELDATVDWHYAWSEAHRDDNAGYNDNNGYGNDSSLESVAWPNDSGDFDAPPSEASSSAGVSFPNISTLDIISAQQHRPSSQMSFRRNMAIQQHQQQNDRRWRRNSSAATDIAGGTAAYLSHSPVVARQLRIRGHTLSAVASPAPSARPWSGAVAGTDAQQHRADERRLAKLLLHQWRQYRLVKVGEEMLRNAVHLKEANVIAKELGQKVVYQFAILRGGAESFPESPLEPDALPAILSDWDTITIDDGDDGAGAGAGDSRTGRRRGSLHLGAPNSAAAAHAAPQVAVKVLDIAHACWYVWSVAALHTQLERMRRLSAVSGSYRAHLELDPFHAGAPRYSCIGTATYPVWPGARAYSAKIDAPVVDSLSRLERGRVRGSMAALPVRGRRGDARAWTVIVHIRSLHGVSESEMTDVHCRMRLARVPELLDASGADDVAEDADASSIALVSASADRAVRYNNPVRGFGDGAINIQFRQQWTVDKLARDTCVVVDFFGRATPLALRRAFHEDVQMEQQGAISPTDQLSASQRLLVERLHEEELCVDSTHEVTLWIRVLELDANGDWQRAPCEFVSGQAVLALCQGVQRRVEVVIGHNTSSHLRFECIEALCIGRPELVDAKGRLAESTAAQQSQSQSQSQQPLPPPPTPVVELPGVRATVSDQRCDNRCFVMAVAPWDTSVLASRLLDAPTPRGMRVRLALELHAGIASGTAPLVLETAFLVRVGSRQRLVCSNGRGRGGASSQHQQQRVERPQPVVSSTQNQQNQLLLLPPLDDGVWRVFAVTLGASGPLLRGRADMWRLNTGNKYVRGEETLLPWQPRSVAFVEHFHRTETRDAWRLRVARTQQLLEAMGPAALRIPRADDAAALRSAMLAMLAPESDIDDEMRLPPRQRQVVALVREAAARIERLSAEPRRALGLRQEPQQREDVSAASASWSLGDIRRLVQRTPLAARPIAVRGQGLVRGWVDVLDTSSAPDAWVRRWLVVERPHLFVFGDSACRFLDNVVNIASARVSAGASVSEVAGRPHVLALYASTSAYLLAPPVADIERWIAALDEWYFVL